LEGGVMALCGWVRVMKSIFVVASLVLLLFEVHHQLMVPISFARTFISRDLSFLLLYNVVTLSVAVAVEI
jgi:hypothetical protein